MRKLARTGLQVLVSALILWALLRRADPRELLTAVSAGAGWPLLLAGALVPVALFLRSLRWYYLLRDAGARSVGVGRAFGLYLVGAALNLVVPGGLGDLAKAYYGHRATGAREEMLSTALIDKLLALFSLCVLGVVAAGITGRTALCLWAVGFAVAFGAPVFFPRLIPWGVANWVLVTFLRKRLDVGKLFRTSRNTAAQHVRALVLSAASSVLSSYIAYLAFWAYLPALGFWEFFAVCPFSTIARLVPFAFAGIGTSDSAMVFLLGPPHHPREPILLGSMTLNVLIVLLPAVVGLVYLWLLPSRQESRPGDAVPEGGCAG